MIRLVLFFQVLQLKETMTTLTQIISR